MLTVGGGVHLSASDLVGHLNCRYLTSLDLAVANGTLAKPFIWDPVLEVLAERGALHEQGYVNHLKTNGLSVTAIDGVGIDSTAVTQTLEAMKAGAQIIVQGALQVAHWNGRADVLLRVEKPSQLGPWSYEVVDTKLARETKGIGSSNLPLLRTRRGRAEASSRIRVRRNAEIKFSTRAVSDR